MSNIPSVNSIKIYQYYNGGLLFKAGMLLPFYIMKSCPPSCLFSFLIITQNTKTNIINISPNFSLFPYLFPYFLICFLISLSVSLFPYLFPYFLICFLISLETLFGNFLPSAHQQLQNAFHIHSRCSCPSRFQRPRRPSRCP